MTQAVQSRIRRRAQYARLSESAAAHGPGVAINRERMTSRVSDERFRNYQDWSSQAGMSPSGRFRVVESPRDRKKLISAEGVRWDLAKAILIGLACIMTVILLVQLASVGASMSQIRLLDEKISSAEEYNEKLSAQLASHTGDISVCTEAVRLNLICSNGAKTIQLTAPVGASLELTPTPVAESSPEIRAALND